MARKKIVKKAAEEPEIELLDPDPEILPIVQEHHQVVRRWKTSKILDDEAAEIEYEDEAEPVRPDPIQAAAEEVAGGSSHRWFISVYKLKDYERNQRADFRAGSHCGVLEVTSADYIGQMSYVEEIQSRWSRGIGTNYFCPVLRRDNRIFKTLPVVSVEPLDPMTAARQAADNPAGAAAINYYLQPQADGFKQFVYQLRQFAEVRDLLVGSPQSPGAQQPQAINTTEQALLHLANADGALIDSVTDRLGRLLRRSGSGDHETTLMDLALEAIKSDLPNRLFVEARGLLRDFIAARAGQPFDPAAPPAAAPPAATPAAPPAAIQNMPPEIILLNFVINAAASPETWDPDTSAAWICEFEERNPSVSPYVTAFLGMSPDQAIGWIKQTTPQAGPVAELATTRDWIAKLQTQLRAEE